MNCFWQIIGGNKTKQRLVELNQLFESSCRTMKQGLIFAALLLFCGSALAEKARYDNYRIYKVSIETAEQLELLKMIEENPDGVSFILKPQ